MRLIDLLLIRYGFVTLHIIHIYTGCLGALTALEFVIEGKTLSTIHIHLSQ